MSEPLLSVEGLANGRASKVRVFADRLEWSEEGLTSNVQRVFVDAISAVTTRRAMVGRYVEVRTPAGRVEFRLTSSDAAVLQETLERVKAKPAATVAPGLSELDRLVQLHADGVLDDEEFRAAKRKLLGL